MSELRRFSKLVNLVVFTLCVAFATISCQVGLGAQVDVGTPSASINYPEPEAIIKGAFVIKGDCSDDMGVSNITATLSLSNAGSGENSTIGEVEAEILNKGANNTNGAWQIQIDPENFCDKKLVDGSYILYIIAKDSSGHKSSKISLGFSIDNHAPVFVITSPSSKDINTPTPFGRKLTVAGALADDHVIKQMNVTIFDTDRNPIGTPLQFTNVEPSAVSSGKIIAQYNDAAAAYLKDESLPNPGEEVLNLHRNYVAIYTSDDGSSDGTINTVDRDNLKTKPFFCQIELVDNAQQWAGDRATDDLKGNSTTIYYNNDDIYDDVLSTTKGYSLTADDLKKILNGTFTKTLTVRSSASGDVTDAQEDVKNILHEAEISSNAFSLNPDAAPYYEVIGGFEVTNVNPIGKNTLRAGGNLTCKVTAGRDNVAVKPWTLAYSFYKLLDTGVIDSTPSFTIVENKEAYLEYIEAEDFPSENYAEVEKPYSVSSGSSTAYTGSFNVPDDFNPGDNYYIIITGEDLEGEELYTNGKFGFQVAASGKSPEVYFDTFNPEKTAYNLNHNSYYKDVSVENSDSSMKFTGIAKTDAQLLTSIIASVTITDPNNSNTKIGPYTFEYSPVYKSIDIANTKTYTWSIDVGDVLAANLTEAEKSLLTTQTASASNSGSFVYEITVSAEDSAQLVGSSSTRQITVDNILPSVILNEVSPTITKENSTEKYINGIIGINGSIMQEPNLDNVYYTIKSNGQQVYRYIEGASSEEEAFTEKFDVGSVSAVSVKFDSTADYYNAEHHIFNCADKKPFEITLYAVDKAGNSNFATATYILDQSTDIPVIESSTIKNGVMSWDEIDWNDENTSNNLLDNTPAGRKITFQISDDDNIKSIEYKIFREGQTDFDKTLSKKIPEDVNSSINKSPYTLEIKNLPEQEGRYRIEVRVSDTKGETTHTTNELLFNSCFAVDANVPAIKLNYESGSFVSNNFELELTLSDTAGISKIERYNRRESPETPGLWEDYPAEPEVTSASTTGDTFRLQNNGQYGNTSIVVKNTVSTTETGRKRFVVYDKYGKPNDVEFRWNIDSKAPVFTLSTANDGKELTAVNPASEEVRVFNMDSGYEFTGEVKDDGSLKADGSLNDDASMIDKLYYKIVRNGSDGKYYSVHMDGAGWTENEVTLPMAVSPDTFYSELKDITLSYKEYNELSATETTEYLAELAENGWFTTGSVGANVNLSVTSAENNNNMRHYAGFTAKMDSAMTQGLKENSDYTIYIAATDRAQNISSIEANPSSVLKIRPDGTAPNLVMKINDAVVESAAESSYQRSNIKVKGTIEEYNLKTFTVTVTKDGSLMNNYCIDLEGNKNVSYLTGTSPNYSFTLPDITTTGDWDISVTVIDKAGIKSSWTGSAKIDNVGPSISLLTLNNDGTSTAINENAVENGKYEVGASWADTPGIGLDGAEVFFTTTKSVYDGLPEEPADYAAAGSSYATEEEWIAACTTYLNTNWTKLSTTTGRTSLSNFYLYVPVTEATEYIYIVARDCLGNITKRASPVVIDFENPKIKFETTESAATTAVNGGYNSSLNSNGDIVYKFTISDTRGFTNTNPELTINRFNTLEKTGDSAVTKGTEYKITTVDTPHATLKDSAGNPLLTKRIYTVTIPKVSENAKHDGIWSINLAVKDAAQRSATPIAINATIDSVVPVISNISCDTTNASTFSASANPSIYFNPTYNLNVTMNASDVTTNVTEISYAVIAGTDHATWDNSYTNLFGSWIKTITQENATTWSGKITEFNTADATKNADGKYTIFVRAKDTVGNISAPKPIYVYVDRTAPVLTELTNNKNNKLYKKATFDLSGVVTDVNLESLKYTSTDNSVNDKVDENIIPSEGTWSVNQIVPASGSHTYTYVFTAKDKAGNIATVNRTVVIDRDAPQLEFGKFDESGIFIPGLFNENKSTNSQNNDFTGIAKDEENGSGVEGSVELWYDEHTSVNESNYEAYIEAAKNEAKPAGEKSDYATTTAATNGEWKYKFNTMPEGKLYLHAFAQDGAGNKSFATQEVRVDLTVPTSTIHSYVSGDDDSNFRLKKINGTSAQNATTTWTTDFAFIAKEEFVLQGKVTDKLGSLENNDEILVSNIKMYKDNNLIPFVQEPTEANDYEWIIAQPKVDGTYTYRLDLEDVAGNKGSSSIKIQIDATGPVVNINAPSPQAIINNSSLVPEGQEHEGELELKFTASDIGTGVSNVSFKLVVNENSAVIYPDHEHHASDPEGEWAYASRDSSGNYYVAYVPLKNENGTFRTSANYRLIVTAKDYLDNSPVENASRTFMVDAVKPMIRSVEVSAEPSGAEEGWYTSEYIEISVEAKDAETGINSVVYNNNDTGDITLNASGETAVNVWSRYSSSTVKLSEGENNIAFIARDKCGNEQNLDCLTSDEGTVPLVKTVYYDKLDPKFGTTKIYKESDTGKSTVSVSNETVVLEGRLTEANLATSNAFTVTAKLNGTVVAASDNTYKIDTIPTSGTDKPWKITIKANSEHTTDGLWEFTITAKDKAGRTTTTEPSVTIDTRAPKFDTLADLDPWYNLASQDLTVNVTDDWDGTQTYENVTGIKSVTYVISGDTTKDSTNMAGGDVNGHYIPYNASPKFNDGESTVTVTAKDAAGNESQITRVYHIDTKAPVLSVPVTTAYLSESVTTSGYNVVLNINDATGGSGTKEFWITAESATGAIVKSDSLIPSQTGSLSKTLNIPKEQFSDDGKYVFVAHAKDAAGNESISGAITLTLDKTSPTIDISNLDNNKTILETDSDYSSGNYTLKGSWSDAISGVKALYYSTADTMPATSETGSGWTLLTNSSGAWTKAIAVTESTKRISLMAVDYVDNISTITRTITVDTSKPTASFDAINTTLYKATGSAQTVEVTGKVTDTRLMVSATPTVYLNGTELAASDYASKNVTVTTDPVAIVGGVSTIKVTYTINVPATGGASDGVWTFGLKGKDASDRESDAKTTTNSAITVDTVVPAISVINASSLAANKNIYETDPNYKKVGTQSYYVLNGTWSDATTGIYKIYYSTYASVAGNAVPTENASTGWKTASTVTPINTEANWTIEVPVVEGDGFIAVVAEDKAGNRTNLVNNQTKFVELKFDFGIPVITITQEPQALTNGKQTQSLVIEGSLTDSYKIKNDSWSGTTERSIYGLKLVAEKDGVAQNATAFFNASGKEENSVNFTITIPGSSNDGKWKFTLTAQDASGREAIPVTREANIDATSPIYTANPTIPAWSKNTTQTLKVNIKDPTVGGYSSGISEVKYKIGSGEAISMIAGSSYSGDSTFTEYSGTFTLTEGESNVTVTAKDAAGNAETTVGVFTYHIDTTAPTLGTITTSKNIVKTSEAVTVTAKATDAQSGIKKFFITKSGSTSAIATKDLDSAVVNTETSSGDMTIAASNFAEGSNEFYVWVEDAVGNQKQSDKIAIVLDETAPVVSINETSLKPDAKIYGSSGLYYSYLNRNSTGTTPYEYTATYSLSGKWKDVYASGNGSGTDKLKYSWDGTTYYDFEGAAAGVTSESSYTVTLPVTEGTGKTLYLKATDAAGNESTPISVTGITIDYTVPEIEFTTALKDTYKAGETLAVEGLIKDSLGMPSGTPYGYAVSVTNATGGTITLADTSSYPNTSNGGKTTNFSSSKTLTANDSSVEGDWTITVTATDASGQTATTTKAISIDVTPPGIAYTKLNNSTVNISTGYYAKKNVPQSYGGTLSGGDVANVYYIVQAATEAAPTYDAANTNWKQAAKDNETTWSATINMNSDDFAENTALNVYFAAVDKVGNATIATAKPTVTLDSTEPVLELTNANAEKITTKNNFVVTGTLTEENLKSFVVSARRNGNTIPTWSPSSTYVKGAAVIKENNVYVCKQPVINAGESNGPGNATYWVQATATTAAESGSEQAWSITLSKDTVNEEHFTDGTYIFTVTATDMVDNVKEVTTTQILLDTTPPKFADTNGINIENNAELYDDNVTYNVYFTRDNANQITGYTLTGDIKDVDFIGGSASGAIGLYYAWVADGTSEPADSAYTSNVLGGITQGTYSSGINIAQGKGKTLYVKLKDSLGNMSTAKKFTGINVDFEKPIIDITTDASASYGINKTITIEGTVTDSLGFNGTKPYGLTVTAKRGNEAEQNWLELDSTSLSDDGKTVTFTASKTISDNSMDGLWTVSIAAKDMTGHSAASPAGYPKNIKIDSTPPTLSLGFTPVAGEETEAAESITGTGSSKDNVFYFNKGNPPEIAVRASDGTDGTGVNKVEYVAVSGHVNTLEGASYTLGTESAWNQFIQAGNLEKWTAQIKGFNTANAADGNYTIAIRAKDAVENTSTTSYIKVCVDSTDPAIEETTPNVIINSDNYSFASGNFTLNGTFTDTNFKRLVVTKSMEVGTGTPADVVSDTSSGTWSITQSVPADGAYTYKWIMYVEDLAGNVSRTLERYVAIDRIGPDVTFTKFAGTALFKPAEGNAVEGTTYYKQQTISANEAIYIKASPQPAAGTPLETTYYVENNIDFFTSQANIQLYGYAKDAGSGLDGGVKIFYDTTASYATDTQWEDAYNVATTAGHATTVTPGNKGQWNITLNDVSEGNWTLHIAAKDMANNWNRTIDRAIRVDSEAPASTVVINNAADTAALELKQVVPFQEAQGAAKSSILYYNADKTLANPQPAPGSSTSGYWVNTVIAGIPDWTNTYITSEAFKLKGTVTDQFAFNAEDITLKIGTSAKEFTSKTPGSGEVNGTNLTWAYAQAKEDGSYTYNVTTKDQAGNTAANIITIQIDSEGPLVSTSFPKESANITTENLETSGDNAGKVKFYGNATDTGTGVALVTYAINNLTSGTNNVITGTAAVNGTNWEAYLDIDEEDDANYEVVITAYDYLNNTSITRVTFSKDTTKPSLKNFNVTSTAPTGADAGFYKSAQINIEAFAKDDESGLAGVMYSTGSDWISMNVENTETNVAPNTGFYRAYKGIVLSEGENTVKVKAIDKADNETGETGPAGKVILTKTITIDSTAPEFGATTLSKTISNTDVTVSGTLTETNLKTFAVTATKNGVEANGVATVTTEPGSGTNKPWVVTLPAPSNHANDGLWVLTITATDKATNTKSVTTEAITIDTTAPYYAPNTITDGWKANATQEIVVHITDNYNGSSALANTSGIQKVTYTITNTDTSDVIKAETSMAAGNVYNTYYTDYSVTTTLEGGNRTVTVKAYDNAGNSTTVGTFNYKIDTTAPVFKDDNVYKTGDATETLVTMSNAGVTIGGTLTEQNLAATGGFTVTAKKDNSTASNTLYTVNAPVSGTDMPWSITLDAPESHSNDGVWIFTITAKDESGNSASIEKTVTIDTTKPVIIAWDNASKPLLVNNRNYNPSNWYKLNTLPIKGYVNENGTGVDYVYYKLYAAGDSTAAPASLVNSNDGSYSPAIATGEAVEYSVALQGFKASTETSHNRVLIQVQDKAGNLSGVVEYDIDVDMEAPNFTSTYYTYDNGNSHNSASGTVVANGDEDMTIYGTVSDSASGMEGLVFYNPNTSTEMAASKYTVTYTTDDVNAQSDWETMSGATYADYDAANGNTIKGWKAVIDKSVIAAGSFKVKPLDKAGNGDPMQILTFSMDKTSPVITLNTPATKLKAIAKKVDGTPDTTVDVEDNPSVYGVNGEVTFSGNTSDDNTLNSIALYYSTTDGTTDYSNDVLVDTKEGNSAYTWSFTKNMKDGDNILGTEKKYKGTNTNTIYFKLVAKDIANNETVNVYEYLVNPSADRPKMSLTYIKKPVINGSSAEYTLLKNKEVVGNIEDDDGTIRTIWYRLKESAWATGKEYARGDMVSYNNTVYICISAHTSSEAIGTENETYWEIRNDEQVDNYKPSGDGSVSNGWKKVDVTNGSFNFEADAPDGEITCYFFLTDAAGKDFCTLYTKDSLDRPYFKYKEETTLADTTGGLTFRADTNSPVINSIAVAREANGTTTAAGSYTPTPTVENTFGTTGWTEAQNTAFGGNWSVLYAKIEIDEATGIDTVKPIIVKLDTTEIKVPVALKEHVGSIYTYIAGPIDVKAIKDIDNNTVTTSNKAYSLQITANDAAGAKGQGSKTIIIDNAAPTVEISYPGTAITDAQIGTVNMKGRATDNDEGSGVSLIKWAIPSLAEVNNTLSPETSREGVNIWTPIYNPDRLTEVSTSTISIDFNHTDVGSGDSIFTYANDTYSSLYAGTTEEQGIWNVPVYFLVYDKLGNWAIDNTKRIVADKLGGKPRVEIITPAKPASGDDPISGGKIYIAGSAQDNISVASVRVQFDVNGDGNFDETDYEILANPSYPLLSEDYSPVAKQYIRATGMKYDSYTDYYSKSGSVYTKVSPETKAGWIEGQTDVSEYYLFEDWYVPASGTSSWKIEIDSTLLRTDDGNYLDGTPVAENNIKLGVQVCAYDGDKNTRGWQNALTIKVDGSAPLASPLKLVQYASGSSGETTVEVDYIQGMYISKNTGNGNWYLTGTVTDDQIFETSSITGQNMATCNEACKLEWTATNMNKWFTVSGRTVTINVPIPTAADGLHNSKITVRDSNGTACDIIVQINIDSSAPGMYKLNAANPTASTLLTEDIEGNLRLMANSAPVSEANSVRNGNYTYTFGDTVNEPGSGLDFIAFYFERVPSSGAERIYNPSYEGYDANGNDIFTSDARRKDIGTKASTDGAFYINDDDLPALFVSDSSRSTEDKIASNSIKNNYNVRVGGLVKIGGAYRKITTVDRTNGSITFTPTVSKTFTTAEIIYAQVVDHLIKEGPTGNDYTVVNNDDGDGMIETLEMAGSAYNWTASIFSDNLVDGKMQLHVVAADKAGNLNHGYVNTYVKNHAPRMSRILLGTDLDGNGTFNFDNRKDIEQDSLYHLTDTADGSMYGEFIYYSTLDSNYNPKSEVEIILNGEDEADKVKSAFVVKNGMLVLPEFTGNINGKLWYKWQGTDTYATYQGFQAQTYTQQTAEKGTSNLISKEDLTKAEADGGKVTDRNIATGMKGISTYIDDVGGVLLARTDLTGYESKTTNDDATLRYFSVTFWDETEETIRGADSQYALLKFPVVIDQIDDIRPNAVIDPFYWKKEGVDEENSSNIYNSLYEGSRANGHIELEDDWKLSSGYSSTATSGISDADPKVSGKIRITGKAYDDTRLGGIKVKIDGFDLGSGVGSYAQLATFAKDTATGKVVWTVTDNFASAGYKFKITDKDGVTTAGHEVAWELDLDTSYVNNGTTRVFAALDRVIEVQAVDASSKTSEASTTQTGTTKTSAEDEDISEEETLPSTAYTWSTTSAQVVSYDRYEGVAYRTTTTETPYYRIDIVPYINKVDTYLATKDRVNPTVYSRTAKGHYPVRRAADTGRGDTNETVKLHGFNLNTEGFVSVVSNTLETGAYVPIINSISAINNMNYNNSKGSYRGDYTDKTYSYCYNRTPNNLSNNLLTDDIYFDVWEIRSKSAEAGALLLEPVMHINPDGNRNQIGFGFVKGADGVSFPADGKSYVWYQKNLNDYSSPNFVYDAKGVAHTVSIGRDKQENTGIAGRMNYSPNTWWNTTASNGNHTANNSTAVRQWSKHHNVALESIGIPNGIYVQGTVVDKRYVQIDQYRFSTPSIAASRHGDNTAVYIMYYDNDHDQTRFRYGLVPNNTAARDTHTEGTGWNQTTVPDSYGLLNDSNSEKQSGSQNNIGGATGIFDDYESEDGTSYKHPCFEASKDYYELVTGDYYKQTNDGKTGTAGQLLNSTGNHGSPTYAMSVVPGTSFNGDIVVMTWYDPDKTKVMYMYRTNFGTGNNNITVRDAKNDGVKDGNTVYWSEPEAIHNGSIDSIDIKVDANNGIHFAMHDTINDDLVYAYKNVYNAESTYSCVVDAYSQIGTNLTLDVPLNAEGNPVPYISYMASGMYNLPKIAYLEGGVTTATVFDGADANTTLFTGNWEVTIIPSSQLLQNYRVSVEAFRDEDGKITTAAAGDAFAISTSPNSSATNTNNASLYANGYTDIVAGYSWSYSGKGYIETAMRR